MYTVSNSYNNQLTPVMDLKRTLLIVDDEVDVCTLLRRKLRQYFQEVQCAHNLTDGYAKAASFQPDVIILDNNLPDGYGLEHIADFKISEKPTRVVMISAMDIRSEAIAAGADEFIGKPVGVGDMQILNSI